MIKDFGNRKFFKCSFCQPTVCIIIIISIKIVHEVHTKSSKHDTNKIRNTLKTQYKKDKNIQFTSVLSPVKSNP